MRCAISVRPLTSEECPRRVRFTSMTTSIAATFAAGQCQNRLLAIAAGQPLYSINSSARSRNDSEKFLSELELPPPMADPVVGWSTAEVIGYNGASPTQMIS